MTRYVFKLLFVLIAFGMLTEINQVMAQDIPQYECKKEIKTLKISDSNSLNLTGCSIREPINEENLKLLADHVFNTLYKHQVSELVINWFLYLPFESDSYLSDIGLTRFVHGKLKSIYVPKARDKVEIAVEDIMVVYIARVLSFDATDQIFD